MQQTDLARLISALRPPSGAPLYAYDLRTVVVVLAARAGDLTTGSLVRDHGLSSASASEWIARALKAQLIERHAHPLDGRSSILRLTPKGERLALAYEAP
jgi:DNA-binding MarR family transcriptional regulator